MMLDLFTQDSPYKTRAKWLATAWTLLIFILCFIPGSELPEVDIPLVDKWTHIVLFAIFTFLWLCTSPNKNPVFLCILMLITVFIGWLVEYIQGHYIPGRTQDNMDMLADSVGGLAGILLFVGGFVIAGRRNTYSV